MSTHRAPIRLQQLALLFCLTATSIAGGASGGCASAGPYGYDRTYRPLPGEGGHFDGALQPTYQDVLRDPNAFGDKEIGWFGVVTSASTGPAGSTAVRLQLRAHQDRHLCRDEERSSCRVTVGQADLGAFAVELTLKPEEETGRDRVGPGSLMKVYGKQSAERDNDNVPVIVPSYYRHWPVGTYVTTAARGAMTR